MQLVGALNWTSTPNARGPVAQQVANFTIDPLWRIAVARGVYVGDPVFPAVVVMDNSAGGKSVTVTINGVPNFVSANSRSHVPLPGDGVQSIDVAGTTGNAVSCVFYADPRDVPPDVPNYAAIVQQAVNLAVPPGVSLPWCGVGAIPAGFLLCDGTAVNRITFANLFAAIGIAYGAGDGVTTFNIPDGRDRAFIGASPGALPGSRPSVRNIGDTGGEETHLLTLAEIVNHNHALTDPQHFHNLASAVGVHDVFQCIDASAAGAAGFAIGGNTINGPMFADFVSTGITIAATGGGGAHNNMSPFFVGQWIIATG